MLQFTDPPANEAANTEAKSNGVQEKPTEEEKEKEEITFTLDEWKAQQAEKTGPKFNTRKAGEGSDLDPKWKKTYAYKKEKETNEEDDEEVKLATVLISLVFSWAKIRFGAILHDFYELYDLKHDEVR